MYDAAANTLSWIATLLGLFALSKIFLTWDRTYPLAIAALAVSIITWLIVRGIESKLTSSNMAIKGKSRALIGLMFAVATIVLVKTHDPAKNPVEHPSSATAASSAVK